MFILVTGLLCEGVGSMMKRMLPTPDTVSSLQGAVHAAPPLPLWIQSTCQ
jgi:hypothetical protein